MAWKRLRENIRRVPGLLKIAPLEAVPNRRVEGKAAARGVSKISRRRLPCALQIGGHSSRA